MVLSWKFTPLTLAPMPTPPMLTLSGPGEEACQLIHLCAKGVTAKNESARTETVERERATFDCWEAVKAQLRKERAVTETVEEEGARRGGGG